MHKTHIILQIVTNLEFTQFNYNLSYLIKNEI